MDKDNNSQFNTENDEKSNSVDLSLSGIIDALDKNDLAQYAENSSQSAQEKQGSADPNSTMNYREAGVSFPEFPFADEKNDIEAQPDEDEDNTLMPRSQKINDSGAIRSHRNTGSSSPNSTGGISSPEQNASMLPGKRASSAKANAKARAASSSADLEQYGDFNNLGSSFRPVNVKSPGYKIRGGGKHGANRSLPAIIVAAVVFAGIGIAALVFGLSGFFGFMTGSSNTADFELSTVETREAIDSRIPVLLNGIDSSIEDFTAAIAETQFTYTNDRYSPDSPDVSATSVELVSMPQDMTTEQMEGYYSGSYNAYSVDELAQFFNGAYMLDIARGDLGSWNKLRYANFNATSIEDEMARLAEIQGLVGDSVTISAEGTDSQGNLVRQGQIALDGERVLYFKIAACHFNALYSPKSLSDASVYITCTLSTYDFYTGSDEITPA